MHEIFEFFDSDKVLHVVSNTGIAIAYYGGFLLLLSHTRRQKLLSHKFFFQVLGIVLFMGGTIHLLNIWTLWHPGHLANVIKALTSIAALGTVLIIWQIISRILPLKNTHSTHSRAFLRNVINCVPDPIFVKDQQHRLIEGNDAMWKLFGRPEEEIVGKSDYDFFPKEEADIFWQKDQEVFDTNEVNINEENFTDALGARHMISTKKACFELNPGEKILVGVIRDVTELKGVEEQLRQSQKMEAVGQLTGGIAHDFNNLLTGIIGGLDLIQRRIASKRFEDLERFAATAIAAANRAASLTHRLLAFSRRQSLNPKPLNLNQLIESMEDMLQRTMGESIALKTIFHDDLWLTNTDENQLESALLNLVINARDAMPKGGELIIETSNVDLKEPFTREHEDLTPGPYIELSVTDTGAGMSSEIVAKAFDPFFTTKAIGQGTGLGLSMVYGFIRQSNGYVYIESEVDKGTTVRLLLPRYQGEKIRVHNNGETNRARHAKDGETVLVVEDNDAVRMLVLEVLEEYGYKTLQASDGDSALSVLKTTDRLDLLVTDIGLPGMNGRQVAKIAREARPDLKILFITGYAYNAAGGNSLAPGMEMITKPFNMNQLASKLSDMIGYQ